MGTIRGHACYWQGHLLAFTAVGVLTTITRPIYAFCPLINIGRGTTDPEIDSVTWIELGNNMAPLTLVAYLVVLGTFSNFAAERVANSSSCLRFKENRYKSQFDEYFTPL